MTGSNSIFVGTKPEEAGIMQGEILADLYAANPERVDKNGDGKVATLEFEGEINNPRSHRPYRVFPVHRDREGRSLRDDDREPGR